MKDEGRRTSHQHQLLEREREREREREIMIADETLPLSEEGSLAEDDAKYLSAEEKKEATTDDNDKSLPLVKRDSSFDKGINNLDNGDDGGVIGSVCTSFDATEDDISFSDGEVVSTQKRDSCPRWADVLSTPSNAAAFTPSADINSINQNVHGWALKTSYDRTKVLSRTGKNCSQLLFDIATLNDELGNAMLKLRSTLDSAVSATPLDNFGNDVNACVLSFATQTKAMAASTQNDIAHPCHEFSVKLMNEATQIYSRYSESRTNCAQARRDALKMRQRCEVGVKDAEGAALALRNASQSKQHSRNMIGEFKTPARSPSQCMDAGFSSAQSMDEVDDIETELSLEESLRRFGIMHGLVKNCDAISRALAEIEGSEDKYVALVEAENAAVANAQDIERQALDAAQQNEERRVLSVIEALNRFFLTLKQALDKMTLDITVKPPNLDMDSDQKELPPPPATSVFLSPRGRLRTTSEESGPAINETKKLNLPEESAELRDAMKSLAVRKSAILHSLKLVSSFNKGIATALETFAVNILTRLENDGFAEKRDVNKQVPLAAQLKKNEGENMLHAWIVVIKALKANAQLATDASKQVGGSNLELHKTLLSSEKELKAMIDGEDFRWKFLCDSAKSEAKAKLKHRQLLADLEKAKARSSALEDDIMSESSKEQKNNAAPSMNKAMGKMFSILPGGGEDVMNKMLTPQQRQGVVMEQMKEAETKEAKAAEVLVNAKSVKEQAIESYITEAKATILKNKSEERRIGELMQESLLCAVDALNMYRYSQIDNVVGHLCEIQTHLQGSVLDDITSWTRTTQKRFEDHRSRRTTDNSENADTFESGFSLRVHRVDCAEMKKLIESVLSEGCIKNCTVTSETAQIEPATVAEVPVEDNNQTSKPPDVPKDPFIKKMDPIFSKRIKGVSIETYYRMGWSDKINPLYRPWLERKGSFDVSVGDWETSENGFLNEWSGETFYQKRVIKFKFHRTTHLYIGPPIAGVTQTQYCCKVGNDKCVLMMTIEMDGIPYSDVFAVEVRWAARRVGTNDIEIDAGVFVRFIKSSMFASKIKSGTLTETKPIHLDLFEELKAAIKSGDNAIEPSDEPDIESEESPEDVVEEEIVQVQVQPHSTWTQLCSMFWSLPKPAQVLVLGASCFVAVQMFFRRPDPTIAKLSRQVENLESEVREMKAMIRTVLEAVRDINNGGAQCKTSY